MFSSVILNHHLLLYDKMDHIIPVYIYPRTNLYLFPVVYGGTFIETLPRCYTASTKVTARLPWQ